MMNFTDKDVPYTRIVEHKHFEKNQSDVTWISYEYPVDYSAKKTEPFYPVNDKINNSKYLKYKSETEKFDNIYFGGRLAEYKYYDMHQVIRSALDFISSI